MTGQPRRRRRWPLALLVVAALLVGLFVAADRIAVHEAERRVADRLAAEKPFTRRPSVHIHGFPFLTQALRGVYSDIEVRGRGAASFGDFDVDTALHGVHIPLSEVSDEVKSVPVDRADVLVTVTLDTLARATKVPGLTLAAAPGDAVTGAAPVDLPGLGTIPVSATVAFDIQGGDIVGTLSGLTAAGVALPDALLAAARQVIQIRVDLSNLPFEAAATGVRVRGSQATITGSARNVVLH